MRVLILPDSFKGTLSASQAAAAMAEGVNRALPQAQCLCYPMADGGEGSSQIAGSLIGAERIERTAIGPEALPVDAFYYRKHSTAFIELAAASGFALSKAPKKTAYTASTFGTGQLIKDAIESGCRDIRLFLGGSATSDAGVGLAKALGAVFYDEQHQPLLTALESPESYPGEQLDRIASIDLDAMDSLLAGISISAAVDVQNPLSGLNGAAHIYGPQKGLSPQQCKERDLEFVKLSMMLTKLRKRDDSATAGAGAAGGAGYAVLAFLNGCLVPGAKFFLDAINFKSLLDTVDIILTGEGRADLQSVQGKLIGEIAEQSLNAKAKVYVLCGKLKFEKIPEQLRHLQFAEIKAPDAMSNAYARLADLCFETLSKQ